ncbi:hypothetical protein OSSY52_14540 [Tepiditoga spiralis]|uniref:Uncharacterized protein n=1 Tax=Tepiditoga spiralis TaxID=2108365 RepID=A0A7G1G8R7_9BACT|nr:hypothetical protein [Tepiditoga spiralis]BBE31313.1 hypothetical protein OSSY52_14540 [Tepiditoga spiralis]
MLFGRKIILNDYDIDFYYKIKNDKFNNMKIADIKESSPQFVLVDFCEKIEPKIISNKFKSFVDFEIKELNSNLEIKILELNNFENILNNIEKMKTVIKEEKFKFDFEVLEIQKLHTKIKEENKINIKIKEKKLEKKIIKKPVKKLKKNISKEYILQLLKELLKEENVSIHDMAFLAFYREVPYGKIKYEWNDKNLNCYLLENNIIYLDAVVFINKNNNEKYLKFIRR